MKRIFPFIAAIFLVAVAVAVRAQDAKPDFSGTWSIDLSKSDFGPMPPPESMVIVVDHKEPTVKTKATQKGAQGETVTERSLTTDGKENANKIMTMAGEQEVKSTSKWDGKKLATSYKLDIQGMAIDVKESWELSEDGKAMTVVRNLSTPQGDFAVTIKLNKQ